MQFLRKPDPVSHLLCKTEVGSSLQSGCERWRWMSGDMTDRSHPHPLFTWVLPCDLMTRSGPCHLINPLSQTSPPGTRSPQLLSPHRPLPQRTFSMLGTHSSLVFTPQPAAVCPPVNLLHGCHHEHTRDCSMLGALSTPDPPPRHGDTLAHGVSFMGSFLFCPFTLLPGPYLNHIVKQIASLSIS